MVLLDGRWGERGEQGGTTGRGDPEEGRGRADAVGGAEERRTGKGREGSPVVVGSPMNYGGRHPRVRLLTPMPSKARSQCGLGGILRRIHLAGVFGLNSVNYPPGFPAEFPPSAVCRRLRGKGPEAGPVAARCEKVVLCATVPSASFSSAPNLRRAERSPPPISPRLPRGWALALAWGRARGRTRRKEHVEHDQKGLG